MGDFDKIIKENIESVFLPLLEKLIGITITHSQEIKDKIQKTIEREPDFLKQVIDNSGQTFILQLEFQTIDDPKMVYRMAEYKAMLQRKYELPVRQFVIYLGAGRSQMITELPDNQQIRGFELKSIHDLSVDEVIDSEIPEEIVLGILMDFPRADTEKIISAILTKLRNAVDSEIDLQRHIQHLLILSRLRKLDEQIEKKIASMPITYDIKTDRLYNKGIKQGIEQGIERNKSLMITNALKQGVLTIAQIAEMADVTIDYVLQIKSQQGN